MRSLRELILHVRLNNNLKSCAFKEHCITSIWILSQHKSLLRPVKERIYQLILSRTVASNSGQIYWKTPTMKNVLAVSAIYVSCWETVLWCQLLCLGHCIISRNPLFIILNGLVGICIFHTKYLLLSILSAWKGKIVDQSSFKLSYFSNRNSSAFSSLRNHWNRNNRPIANHRWPFDPSCIHLQIRKDKERVIHLRACIHSFLLSSRVSLRATNASSFDLSRGDTSARCWPRTMALFLSLFSKGSSTHSWICRFPSGWKQLARARVICLRDRRWFKPTLCIMKVDSHTHTHTRMYTREIDLARYFLTTFWEPRGITANEHNGRDVEPLKRF